MISNNGLNSKEAREESTATNSSVTLSGIRREKEAPTDLDITDYSRNPGNSDPPLPRLRRGKPGELRGQPPTSRRRGTTASQGGQRSATANPSSGGSACRSHQL